MGRETISEEGGERKAEGKQESSPYLIIQLAPLNAFCKIKINSFFLGKK